MISLTKPKLIGCVSCDSGEIAVVDPCHIEVSESGAISLPRWNLFTCISTEVGDSEFAVYEQRDWRGKLRRVVIEMN